MNKRLKTIPKFASEAAERAFWEKNDSTGYLDWKKTQLSTFKLEAIYPDDLAAASTASS
jgi:hypothetical protein